MFRRLKDTAAAIIIGFALFYLGLEFAEAVGDAAARLVAPLKSLTGERIHRRPASAAGPGPAYFPLVRPRFHSAHR